MKTITDLNSDIAEYENIINRGRWLAVAAVQLVVGNLRRFGIDAEILTAMKRELHGWDASKKRWKP